MARTEARLLTSIWDDADWLDLSPGAQWMYTFLTSQPDVAHTGLLALRERRWSTKARGMTVETLRALLAELSAARFVLIDDGTEELLIRSYVRGDKVYRQPNLMRAAESQMALISSPALRAAFALELRRVLTLDDCPDSSKAVVERMLTSLPTPPNPPRKGPGNPSPIPSGNPSDRDSSVLPDENPSGKGSRNPSGIPSGNPLGDRGVTAVRKCAPNPSPLEPDPLSAIVETIIGPIVEPEPPSTDVAIPEPPINAGTILGAWIDHCAQHGVKLTKRAIGHYAKVIKTALDEGFPPQLVKIALANMLAEGVAGHPSYLDNHLIAAQNGPRRRARRLTPGEESARDLASGADGAQVIQLFRQAVGIGEVG